MRRLSSQSSVNPPTLPSLDQGVTVEAWVECEGVRSGAVEGLVCQWRDDLGSEGVTSRQSGAFRLCYSDIGANGSSKGASFGVHTDRGRFEILSPNVPPAGRHHLAGTYDGKEIRLYIDGGLVAKQAGEGRLVESALPVTLGCLQNAVGEFSGAIRHAALFPAALTATEIAAKYAWHLNDEDRKSRLRVELETYYLLKAQKTLRGRVILPDFGTQTRQVNISIQDRICGSICWQRTLAVEPGQTEISFQIPVEALAQSYCLVEVTDDLGRMATAELAIRQEQVPGREKRVVKSDSEYLTVAQSAVDRILATQSRRYANQPDGAVFVTTNLATKLAYRSIGYKNGKSHASGLCPGGEFEFETYRADHEIWPVLEALSEQTGDPCYQKLAENMMDALRDSGFDSRSGLVHFGQECDFDVRRAEVCSNISGSDVPKFKPINDGFALDMHVESFWRRLPKQTHRWLRATCYGHVTDQESMDFNRVAFYGFDDRERVPSQMRNNGHCGFECIAGSLIYFWASCWLHAEDEECLQWAQRMTDKWARVQNADTGLVPNFFGAGPLDAGSAQVAGTFVETRGAALGAENFLKAADLLRRRPGAEALAKQLFRLGSHLAVGTASHAYDLEERRFHEHLHLDGRIFEETARYCFRTVEEKQEAMRIDPEMAEVPVYDGAGLYRRPNYYELCAGSNIPYNLSGAALLCRDPRLVNILKGMMADAVEESAKIPGAFTPENRWTFRATGWYVKTCLRLFEITGDRVHRDQARQLADREISALKNVKCPDWWRMRERTIWLDALLDLAKQTAGS